MRGLVEVWFVYKLWACELDLLDSLNFLLGLVKLVWMDFHRQYKVKEGKLIRSSWL